MLDAARCQKPTVGHLKTPQKLDGGGGGETWNEFGRASDNENETRRARAPQNGQTKNKTVDGNNTEKSQVKSQPTQRIKTSKVILRFGQQQRQRRSEIKKCRRRQHFPPKLPTAFWPTKWPVSTVNCFVRAVELLGAWEFWRFVFRFCSFLRGSSYFLNQFGYFGTYSSQLLLIATKTLFQRLLH